MKSRKYVFICACILGMSSIGADCLKSKDSSPTSPTNHQTKIIGVITGEYAEEETVTFSIDGAVIGDATGSGTVSKIVTFDEPHTISATSKNIPLTLSTVVTLKENEINTFNFPCKAATVTIKTDAALIAFNITQITVFSVDEFGKNSRLKLNTGESGTFTMRPNKKSFGFEADDQNGKLITSTSVMLNWDSKFAWTISK